MVSYQSISPPTAIVKALVEILSLFHMYQFSLVSLYLKVFQYAISR